jgi:hypothetical protein
MKIKQMVLWMALAALNLSSCIGSSALDEDCPSDEENLTTTSSTDFILDAKGDSFVHGPWTFSTKPGENKSNAVLRVYDAPNANLGVNVDQQYTTQTSGQTITLGIPHYASRIIPPLRVVAREPFDGVVRATLNTGASEIPAQELVVMQKKNQLATPDFTIVPSQTTKSFVVTPRLDSLGGADSGWLYVIAHQKELVSGCVEKNITNLERRLGEAIGDKLTRFADDPCRACQTVAGALTDLTQCKEYLSNLGPDLCSGALAAAGIEGWKATITNGFCTGASYLGSWATSFISNFVSVPNPVDYVCGNTELLNRFLAKYKINADCMCELYVRSPTCEKREPLAECKSIWADMISGKP